ncbi:MAG: 2-C-methyl-D-erythritol 4-phosphate cytidylyltransferase [bacterium]|nr:2-C-methyl-D-erythritol 4-phosphate cytidylyltransferase [bacterium]
MKNYAIITAAGKGTRLPGAVAKQFRPVGSKPLLAWTIDKFEQCPSIDAIHLVVSGEDLNYTHEAVVDRFKYKKVERIVAGGKTRFDSILCGLRSIPETANLVYIHDGVRPLVSIAEIEAVGKQAEAFDAAILAVRQTETLKRIEDGFVIATLDRDKIWVAQTPQVFKYEAIISAYIQALESKRDFTDDSAVCEAFGISVRIVEGSTANIKVTTPEDLDLARKLLTME